MAEELNKLNEDKVKFEGNYLENVKDEVIKEAVYPGKLISWKQSGQKLIFYAETTVLELTIVSNVILKFRFANDGYFEDDFSYAVDPRFKPEPINFKVQQDDKNVWIETNTLCCTISKVDLSKKISTLDDTIIIEDEQGYHCKEERKYGGHVVISTIKKPKDSKYYGLGDKTGSLNLDGTKRELWGTDCYGYGNDTDPVYKNIPFFLGLHKNTGYGIFLDNSFRTFFDFGKERKDVISFWAQGGEMRYYFIYGPKLTEVAKQYTNITGKAPLPPKWALGYHQSKWSYYPESTVRELADTFRAKRIPCDVIHLDIDYMDGYRCFTWDPERFPNPKGMIDDLQNQGFKTIVIIDPGIKIDPNYPIYQQGVHYDLFCKRMDGARLKGNVWPGPCYFPDFTNPEARRWWAGLYSGLMETGVAGVWNDMNEPAVFETGTFPYDVRHDYDGHACSHRKAHNVYGMQMARATNEGQQQFSGNKRAFTITRSAYAGIQRFSSVWTGDNMATWEHLKIANIQCQRLSASGVSFAGSDVGGFIETPTGELYTRWIQLATFHPFFRTHSSGDHGDKEPWVFDDKYVDIVRRFIEFRYELLPYLYTVFNNYVETGMPMIRSLHLAYQEDTETHLREEEFLLGDHILVCPVSQKEVKKRKMYLPEGTWFHFWSDDKFKGKQEIEIRTPLNEIPLFIQAGAIIPMQPVMQYVDEFIPDELTLHIYYPAKETISELYQDDGETQDYQRGVSSCKSFTSKPTSEGAIITQEIDGYYESLYKGYRIVLHGFSESISIVEVDGKSYPLLYDKITKQFTGSISKRFNTLQIK